VEVLYVGLGWGRTKTVLTVGGDCSHTVTKTGPLHICQGVPRQVEHKDPRQVEQKDPRP